MTCTHCYIYLLLAVPCLRCYTQAFSSCGEQGLLPSCGAVASLVAESRLQGQGLQQLQHMGSAVVTCGLEGTWAQYLWLLGSVVVAHGLSCSTVCEIFPDQRSNPYPLHWHVDSHPLNHQESPTGGFLTAGPPGMSSVHLSDLSSKFLAPAVVLGSCVQLFVTPWTIACQAPLSTGFSRQEHWSRLLFPPAGDLHYPHL